MNYDDEIVTEEWLKSMGFRCVETSDKRKPSWFNRWSRPFPGHLYFRVDVWHFKRHTEFTQTVFSTGTFGGEPLHVQNRGKLTRGCIRKWFAALGVCDEQPRTEIEVR